MKKYLVKLYLQASYDDCLEIEAESPEEAANIAEIEAKEMLAKTPIELFEKEYSGVLRQCITELKGS